MMDVENMILIWGCICIVLFGIGAPFLTSIIIIGYLEFPTMLSEVFVLISTGFWILFSLVMTGLGGLYLREKYDPKWGLT
jgi:hypothetical protein